MKIAYLDCFAGISGDMLLGALVGAGVPLRVMEDAARAMKVGATLRQTTVDRSGIAAIKIDVVVGGLLADTMSNATQQQEARPPMTVQRQTQHRHREGHGIGSAEVEIERTPDSTEERSLSVILQMIAAADLSQQVKEMATRTFALLGASEAKIHNVVIEEIHFHEVGAVDAIVDIVAACAGVVNLGQEMGVERWFCSPVNVGSGTVRCAHGVFPVPAPATADLLRGVPTYAAHVRKELVTPTGAALLRVLAPEFGEQPMMRVDSVGYGAGTRNPVGFANVLRLSVGEAVPQIQTQIPFGNDKTKAGEIASKVETPYSFRTDETKDQDGELVCVLETALDDATPQLLAYVVEKALELGALDVMQTAASMKKGRLGTLLTVLCRPDERAQFEEMLVRETTTLGVRSRLDRRVCLGREQLAVETEFGTVRVKTGRRGDEVVNAHPEFEDCRKAAREHNVPLKHVVQAALAAYARRGVA